MRSKRLPLIAAIVFAVAAGCTLGIFVAQAGEGDQSAYLSFAGALLGTSGSIWGAFAVIRYGAVHEQTEAHQMLIQILMRMRAYIRFLQEVDASENCGLAENERRVLISTSLRVFINGVRFVEDGGLAQRSCNTRTMLGWLVFVDEARNLLPIFERALADFERDSFGVDGKADQMKISPAALRKAKAALNRFINSIYNVSSFKARLKNKMEPTTNGDI
jgi:hypothetical protein